MNKIYIKEFQIEADRKNKMGSEGIVYLFGDYVIKRVTARGIAYEPTERDRIHKLHEFLTKIEHPNIAPVLFIRTKKDEKGNFEYIEILKKKYLPLRKDERQIVFNFYMVLKRHFNSSSLKQAMQYFIAMQDQDYQDNLKKLASAILLLKRKGVSSYLATLGGKPYFDLHDNNVMKKEDGEWIIIDF